MYRLYIKGQMEGSQAMKGHMKKDQGIKIMQDQLIKIQLRKD